MERGVDELAAVVGLERQDGAAKLCLHERMEGNQRWENVRLVAERERPNIVGVVVKHDEVVLTARMAQDR